MQLPYLPTSFCVSPGHTASRTGFGFFQSRETCRVVKREQSSPQALRKFSPRFVGGRRISQNTRRAYISTAMAINTGDDSATTCCNS